MAQTKTIKKSSKSMPDDVPVKPVQETPVVDATVVEPVVETEKPQSTDVTVTEKFESLNQKVVDITNALKELQSSLKVVQKELVKLVKTNVKKGKSRTNTGAKKTPSGFAKPTKLSDALCDFLGVSKGTELARTEVTRRLNAYIKAQGLQDEKDKRNIHPDAKLSQVLSIKEGDKLTFFNLQTAIKHNFVKAA